MEDATKNKFCVKYYFDFTRIPMDTQILIIEGYPSFYNDQSTFENLPVLLEEIHFNFQDYIFDTDFVLDIGNPNVVIKKYNIKVPFGCKIYKFGILQKNFDDVITVKGEYGPSGTSSGCSYLESTTLDLTNYLKS